MIREMDEARHAEERGAILCALKQEYGSSMVAMRTLAAALNLTGYPLTNASLQFSLTLLADCAYVRTWTARDMGIWRPDRANEMRPETIVFAKLLPKGLSLVDGKIEPDPNVSF